MILDNREFAALILLGVGTLWVLSHRQVRESAAGLINAFIQPQIVASLVVMLAWVVLEVHIGAKLGLWSLQHLKGTVLWTICCGSVLLFKVTNVDSTGLFFRQSLTALVQITVFIEFFTNLYTMSLAAELVLQIVVVTLVLLVSTGSLKPEYKPAKRLCEVLLAGIGIGLLIYSVTRVYMNWNQLEVWELILKLGLPIWLTFGLLPFLFIFSVFVTYDSVFRQIDCEPKGCWPYFRPRFVLLTTFWFRTGVVRKFIGYWPVALGKVSTLSATKKVVKEFVADQEYARKSRLDAEERTRRYKGSQELDDEGRRLDRRKFKETITALYWLANCQMGWYPRKRRYRNDMLKILDNDFTRQGLPRDSGIVLQVSKDGQAWYAWRRTVSGWCFAIGAAGPPPEQWEHDGPEPPQGFPGTNLAWGDEPFSNQANCNWR